MMLWPKTPKPDSWLTDLPNEGLEIGWGADEDSAIASYHADYQGYYIVEPREERVLFASANLPGCTDPQYLAAYMVIIEELATSWSNPVPPEGYWTPTAQRIVARLTAMGWREVVPTDEMPDANGRYYRYVPDTTTTSG